MKQLKVIVLEEGERPEGFEYLNAVRSADIVLRAGHSVEILKSEHVQKGFYSMNTSSVLNELLTGER